MAQKNESGLARWALVASLALVALLCLALWYLRNSHVLVQEHYTELQPAAPGVWDLTGEGAAERINKLAGDTTYIAGALLTPEEFEAREDEMVDGDVHDARVVTSRMRVLLSEGTYVLAGDSTDYAERIYVNGELRREVGVPTETAAGFQPAHAFLYLEVHPVNGVLEIVQQSANFVHRENGGHALKLGPPAAMERMTRLMEGLTALTMGIFLCMFVIHLTLFLIFRSYRPNLYFALFCLAWFLRTGLTGGKLFWGWFPGAPWAVFFRTEYLTLPVACVCVILLLHKVFSGLLPRWFLRGVLGLSGLYALLCLFLPTIPLSWSVLGYEAVLAGSILIIAICLFRWLPGQIRRRSIATEQWITLAGLGIFSLVTLYDILYFNDVFILTVGRSMSDAGLLIFALYQMIAMFQATMRSVTEAHAREHRAQAEKELLEEMNRHKTAFYTEVSHEMKTPLTVMAVNAEFAAQNIAAGDIDEETITDLTAISAEANRLAQMVTGLVRMNRVHTRGTEHGELHLDALAQELSRMYQSLFARRGNTLRVEAQEGLPPVGGSAEQLDQVLINLLSNANRHTQDGAVVIRLETMEASVRVSVEDNGEGIGPELLPHVFERFARGHSDGTGLGLPICKAIIEGYGGGMGIESELGKGTRVWFTLPVKEAVKDE